MFYYGLEWQSLDSYMQFKEITAPATPPANEIRQYATDSGGISTMCWKNDAGNVTCLSTGGGTIPTGSGGVAGAVAFWTSATNLGADDPHFHWDDTNDQLMIGINAGSHFGTDAGIVVDEDGASSIIGTTAHSNTVSHAGGLNLQRSRGTHAGQSIVADADRISRIVSQAYDGGAYRDAAAIDAIVNGTPGASDMPGALQFLTTPDGSITLSIRATLDQKGDFGLGTVTPNYAGFTRAITIESGTNVALELASSRADADDAGLGFVDARYKTNSVNHNRVAAIQFKSSGTTANQRGGMIQLMTKADASTTLAERFRTGPLGQWGIGGATFGGSGDIFSSGGASAAPTWVTRATLNAALDHGLLAGLGDDDHTQYALLAGRAGGQTLIGGTGSTDTLTLKSTSHADGSQLSINSIGVATSTDIGAAVNVAPTFTGAPTVARGFRALATFQPSSTINTGIGFVGFGFGDPASGKTLTNLVALATILQTGSNGGTVTTGRSIQALAPIYGSVKPTTAVGVTIENHGSASITTAVGLQIDAQSGATNNFVFALPTDNTDPTGGGGAATGRIPCLIGGALRYLAYY